MKTQQKQSEIEVLELRLGSLGSDIDLKLFFNNPRQWHQKLVTRCF